jgi:hypothetical protein
MMNDERRIRSEAKMKVAEKEFLRGFGIAIGALARDHGEPTMAADIARSNGITLADLRRAGVEAFDLTKNLRREMCPRGRGIL